MAGIYRDERGRFISAEKYLNNYLPASISWSDPDEIKFFETERLKISQKYGLSFDEEENEFFKPFKVKGSLKENADFEQAKNLDDVFNILSGQEIYFPYWEATGYVHESGAERFKIFVNEKLIYSGKNKDRATEISQDFVRNLNDEIKTLKKNKQGSSDRLTVIFPIEEDGILEMHFIQSEEIETENFDL